MKNILCALLIIALPGIYKAQTKKLSGPLDGKTFTVDLFKEGKKKPLDADELKFIGGKFKSTHFADWGYTKASIYQITSVDSTSASKTYVWTCESINDIKDKMIWSGTITGDDIEGTCKEGVNENGESKYSYTFTGKLKKKPGQK